MKVIVDAILLLFQLLFILVILVTSIEAEPGVEKYLVLGALAAGALMMIIILRREARQEKSGAGKASGRRRNAAR